MKVSIHLGGDGGIAVIEVGDTLLTLVKRVELECPSPMTAAYLKVWFSDTDKGRQEARLLKKAMPSAEVCVLLFEERGGT